MTPTQMIILAGLMLLANTVEAMAGFGSTVLTLTLGAAWFDINSLIPYLLPLNLVLSTTIVVRHRHSIALSVWLRQILPLMALGLCIGMALITVLHGQTLEKIFGGFVVAIAVFELINIARQHADFRPKPLSNLYATGWLLVGGIVQGMYASGGPMLVYFGSRQFETKAMFRATLSATWLVLNIIMTAVFVVQGRITSEVLTTDVWLLAPVIGGMFLGDALHHRVNERTFRIGVFVLLTVAGTSILLR